MKKAKSNDLSDFSFRRLTKGNYRVIYETHKGDFYIACIKNRDLIRNTVYSHYVKVKVIEELRAEVKRLGRHYHADGAPFEINKQ